MKIYVACVVYETVLNKQNLFEPKNIKLYLLN